MLTAEHMIPNIYEQSSDMRTVCRLIDAEAEILEYYTNHILDCYSPEHCPNHLVEELATHIGFKYNDLKTLMYNRVVLKNFIKYLIRYRGSATGIRNAAAIDIRYRQTHTYEVPNESDPENPGTVTETVPMEYHESIDIDTAWVDADADAGIIYLFVIAGNYFTQVTQAMLDQFTPETDPYGKKKKAFLDKMHADRMRKLLDFAYLQEYVRPVGMYLLPMVARKVDPYTDLTVKAVRIPSEELNHKNNVFGTPNASMEHTYDRMLFAKVENPDDELSVEPWLRTLYHSQLAGKLTHQYFTAPVFHIEQGTGNPKGGFLYYDHSELLNVFSEIISESGGTMGTTKLGDALYNPNRVAMDTPDYTYGDDITGDPVTLQTAGKAEYTSWPLSYKDSVGFPIERVYQTTESISYPIITSPDEEFPIYMDVRTTGDGEVTELWTDNSYTMSAVESDPLAYLAPNISGYLQNAYLGTHQSAPEFPYGDGDNGTNKNFIFTLYDVDEQGKGEYVDADSLYISGKHARPSTEVPYDPATNDDPIGSDFNMTLHSEYENPEELIP